MKLDDITMDVVTFLQSQIDSIAKGVMSAEGGKEAIDFALKRIPVKDDEIKAWRAALPYMFAIGMFMSILERQEPTSDDIIIGNIYKILGAGFIWDKIKHTYPNLQDGNDITSNSEGLAIAQSMIERWTATGAKFSKEETPTTSKSKTKRAGEAVLALSKVEDNLFSPGNFDELFGQHGKGIEEKTDFRILTDRKKNVVTLLSVDWDENDLKERGVNIPSWNRLTAFDRAVYMATASLFFAGNRHLTSRMVYQVLCGNKAKVNPTPDMIKQISRSISRMSVIRVTIDATAEFKAKRNDRAEYEDYMLNTTIARAMINGVMSDCVQVNTPPVLYLYANAKNQIARMDVKMLDAPINNTPENIELKDYLMRRVSNMKSDKSKLGNVIRYGAIYDYLHIETAGYSEQALRHKKKDVRDTVKKIFEDWIAKGEIESFEEVSEGRTKAKVILKFKDKGSLLSGE